MHSPPEREKTTLTHKLLEKYNSNTMPPSYVDTEEKPLISVGIAARTGGPENINNNHGYAMSYENTIDTDLMVPSEATG